LPPELGEAVRALALSTETTPFMVLLAGFEALLSRYSGQEDLAGGAPIAGGNRAEGEGLIGFFVNTLVVRGGRSGAPGFGELPVRVRGVTLPAFVHQEVPFEKLVEELAPERSRSHAPLFQVMFALQNQEMGGGGVPLGGEVSLEPLGTGSGTAKFDLT